MERKKLKEIKEKIEKIVWIKGEKCLPLGRFFYKKNYGLNYHSNNFFLWFFFIVSNNFWLC
jgi:hypothetical protein